jgi:hypothetical protein
MTASISPSTPSAPTHFANWSSSPAIIVRQLPIVGESCLREPCSSSSNSNKVALRRRFLFNKPNQRSPLLQSLPAPGSSRLVDIDAFASRLLSFLFRRGR